MEKVMPNKETLREEFYSKIAEFSAGDRSIDPYPMQRIADFWLSKLDELEKKWEHDLENSPWATAYRAMNAEGIRKGILEQMEKCKECIENPPFGDSEMWQGRLEGMAQILDILSELTNKE